MGKTQNDAMTTPPGVCQGCGRNRLEREPHLVDCVANRRVIGAKSDVIAAAIRLDDCANEFDGEMAICGEYLNALFDTVERLKKSQLIAGER